MRRIFLTLAACALTAFALAGCGNTAETNTNTVTTANTTKTTTTTTTTTSSGSSSSIGIAACDEYVTKMEKCMASNKVPEAAKAAYRSSLAQYREQWKKAAADPNTKGAIGQGCQAALDGAKTFFASCE